MSEPLELQAQRPYALDQLTMLQSQIMQTIQGMVVLRARIEKQRRSNIEAARDTYTELDRARERLIEQLPSLSCSCWRWRSILSQRQPISFGVGLRALT